MFNILETVDKYNDTWKMTFYFVAAIAIMIGLFWTIRQMIKKDASKQNKLKENLIYNKSYDAIENDSLNKKKKDDNRVINYYDVYQNENKIKKNENIVDENKDDNN